MPVAELVAQGRVFWGATLREMGYSLSHVEGLLRRDFPNEQGVSIHALLNRIESARASATVMESRGADERLRAREVMDDPLGGRGWGYLSTVNWRNAQTGEVQNRTVVVHANQSLTNAELLGQAIAVSVLRQQLGRRSDASPAIGEGFVPTDIDIIAVQRE